MGKAKKLAFALLDVFILLLVLTSTEAGALEEAEGKGGEDGGIKQFLPPAFSGPQIPGPAFSMQLPSFPGLSTPTIPGIPGVPLPPTGNLPKP